MSEPNEPAHYDPLVHLTQPDRRDAEAVARARVGKSIRDIGHAVVGRHASPETLDEVASTVESLVARLEQGEPRQRHEASPEGPGSAGWQDAPVDGEIMSTFDERPISGRASPWGLDFDVHREGDEAVGIVTMRAAHEGAPGRSHGGIVAAVFDDVFGFVLNIIRVPAFTGELTIRYVAGTPIGVPLECRVRLAGREGRKILLSGELTDAGRVVATSKATFIAIDLERFHAGAGA